MATSRFEPRKRSASASPLPLPPLPVRPKREHGFAGREEDREAGALRVVADAGVSLAGVGREREWQPPVGVKHLLLRRRWGRRPCLRGRGARRPGLEQGLRQRPRRATLARAVAPPAIPDPRSDTNNRLPTDQKAPSGPDHYAPDPRSLRSAAKASDGDLPPVGERRDVIASIAQSAAGLAAAADLEPSVRIQRHPLRKPEALQIFTWLLRPLSSIPQSVMFLLGE